jgi:hypothetical protein
MYAYACVCVCGVCVVYVCACVCVCVCVYKTDDFLYVRVCIKAAWAARLDVSNVRFLRWMDSA